MERVAGKAKSATRVGEDMPHRSADNQRARVRETTFPHAAGKPGDPTRSGLAGRLGGTAGGVDGTSSSEHSRQRPGDGVSPGVLSGAKITPSRRKSARRARRRGR